MRVQAAGSWRALECARRGIVPPLYASDGGAVRRSGALPFFGSGLTDGKTLHRMASLDGPFAAGAVVVGARRRSRAAS